MLNQLSVTESSFIPDLPSKADDQLANKAQQSCLIFIYEAKIADFFRNVTITWCKNLTNHSLSINIDNPSDNDHHYTCKIDLKGSHFWNKKGLKNLEVDGKRVYIYWDFRQAKFSSSPAPSSDYYVGIVYEQEIVLLLGDLQTDAYKRIQKKPSLVESTLLCKKENVLGKNLFCTRSTLGEEKQEHDIVIETSLSGPSDPEMWISIDGITTIHIMNLSWRFRGNETIIINNTLIQIYWDVHDWLFDNSTSTRALFIFNPRTVGCSSNGDSDGRNFSAVKEGDEKYDTTRDNNQSMLGFCHILYAWRIK